MSSGNKILIAWVFMVALMLAGSLVPNFGPPQKYHVDKLFHLAAYGALMFFPAFFLRGRRRALLIAVALIIISFAVEFAQNYMPSRKGSYGDMLFNFFGVMGGLIFGRMFKRISRRAKNRRTEKI